MKAEKYTEIETNVFIICQVLKKIEGIRQTMPLEDFLAKQLYGINELVWEG